MTSIFKFMNNTRTHTQTYPDIKFVYSIWFCSLNSLLMISINERTWYTFELKRISIYDCCIHSKCSSIYWTYISVTWYLQNQITEKFFTLFSRLTLPLPWASVSWYHIYLMRIMMMTTNIPYLHSTHTQTYRPRLCYIFLWKN